MTVEPGWEGVQEAFEGNFASGEEVGAGCAVYHRGKLVVDLVGGHFDEAKSKPYTDDALQIVFSTTKGVTAVAVAMCVDRGLIDYDEKVTTYWPEFAANGKGDATVAQLLSHQCGLISVDAPTSRAEALDWKTITSRLAEGRPEWPIGTAHGYHALTYGWLAGELIRRTDGRTPGQFVAEEIAGPLGLDLWIGLPAEHEPRVSPMLGSLATKSDDPAVQAMIDQFFGPGSNAYRALYLNGAFEFEGQADNPFNTAEVHAAEIPAGNGIANARSLAKLYAATLGEVDGVQLLSEATRDRARVRVTPDGETDQCLMLESTFGMGFMVHGPMTVYSGPGSYGHPGAGGSVAFAQPERDLAFAYVMNQMATNLAGDMRAQRLLEAAAAAADATG